MSELDRIRWHCRRGMLELDLVLNAFVERDYPTLDAEEARAFKELLEFQDQELYDLVMGRSEPPEGAVGAILRRVQAS